MSNKPKQFLLEARLFHSRKFCIFSFLSFSAVEQIGRQHSLVLSAWVINIGFHECSYIQINPVTG